MRIFLAVCITFILLFAASLPVRAQGEPQEFSQQDVPTATDSTVFATDSSVLIPASPFPNFQSSDIVRSDEEANVHFIEQLSAQELGGLSLTNPIRYAIRTAVNRGIAPNTIVFLLLFPLIALVISISRHIVGLTGLSLYAPAALAVALLSLGIVPGTALFIATITCATLGKRLLFGLKLPYLPRTSLMLWFVSLGIFLFLLLSTYVEILSLTPLNIFALLILILLSENFLEIQSQRTRNIAIQRALETFALALLCAITLGSRILQMSVLLYPEIFLLCIGILNIVVGKYLGLRITEWFRFRPIMDHEE